MAILSNKAIWDIAVENSKQFEDFAAKTTYDQFKAAITDDRLFGQNRADLADQVTLLLRTAKVWYLREVVAEDARDYLSEAGIGYKINMPFGDFLQMMYVHHTNTVSPIYKDGIIDGNSIDQQIITLDTVDEVFWGKTLDFQDTYTITDIQLRDAFRNENGLGMYIAAKMKNTENNYTNFIMTLKEEMINQAINNTDHPLGASQIVEVELDDVPTTDQHKAFICKVNNIIDAMEIKATTAYNRAAWPVVQDHAKLCIMVRPTFANALKAFTLSSLYNPENLALNIKESNVIKVADFGGLVAQDGSGNNLVRIEDSMGRLTGYAEAATPTVPYTGTINWADPNEDVIAVLCDKEFLVETETEAYNILAAPYNARGRYQTFWASKAGIGMNIDVHKNFVVIRKATSNQNTSNSTKTTKKN